MNKQPMTQIKNIDAKIRRIVLALFCIAFIVFFLQIMRLPHAWLFVSLYWLVLTIKNYLELKK